MSEIMYACIVSFVSGIGFAFLGYLLLVRYWYRKYQLTGEDIQEGLDRLFGNDD